jgi:hypothetical protein
MLQQKLLNKVHAYVCSIKYLVLDVSKPSKISYIAIMARVRRTDGFIIGLFNDPLSNIFVIQYHLTLEG